MDHCSSGILRDPGAGGGGGWNHKILRANKTNILIDSGAEEEGGGETTSENAYSLQH